MIFGTMHLLGCIAAVLKLVYPTRDEEAVAEISPKFTSLSQGTGNNGCGSGSEHKMEEPGGQPCPRHIITSPHAMPKETVTFSKCQRPSYRPVCDPRDN